MVARLKFEGNTAVLTRSVMSHIDAGVGVQ
jgi:hypothetical protein